MTQLLKPIVVVGSITMDLVTRTPRIPAVGQTLIGTGFETNQGGKGANQAVAAARLGYPVAMVAKVGNDAYGPELIASLERAGVDTAAMEAVAGSSGLAPIYVADGGHNLIVVVPGANGKMDRSTVDKHADLIRSAGMVLCQLEIPMDTLAYTLEFCTRAGVPVMLDPAPAADLPQAAWNQVAWFTPNETEAAHYVGDEADVEASAKKLLAKGLRGVVLKRGGEGAYVAVSGGKSGWVQPYKVDAIDTVAAGDCFNGAFAVALLEGNDPWTAARFANAAAAICVTRKGAAVSMPKRAEVDEFVRSNS
ncbi:MAG TPA: ribokinase [Terracidiphilus sp.]|nr:ribokinase [Terracidiphilus sp.]